METTGPTAPDLSDYLGLLRRQWWLVVLGCTLGVGAGLGATQVMPKTYESVTSVLVQPAGQDTNVAGGRTKGDINLDTEAQLVGSTQIAVGAADLLRSGDAPDVLAKGVSVTVPPNTAVLEITYKSADPARAQTGSHAFAEAYLRNREASAQAGIDAQISALNSKVKQLNTSLTQINSKLADLPRDSASRPSLESQRSTNQSQLNSLSGKLNDLTTETVSAGKIISDAQLPTTPSKPNRKLNLATGAMLGLLLGLSVAVIRERLDRRVRAAADVERASRVPVLAELTLASGPQLDEVFQPYATGGRTFNRLRNEVLASLRPEDRVVVVAGASRGVASTLVAANLAAAMARSGSEVLLLGAHLPDSMVDAAPLARLFGVGATPGLGDVLTGKVPLRAAVQRAPRVPSLRVITTGGTGSAGGLLQSQALRQALGQLRRRDWYVVIDAPSTASSADAQSLARLADAAILTVELRRTRRPEVVDAVAQLTRVGTPLLGTVVIPRLVPAAESQSGLGDDDADFSHDEDTPDFDDLRDLDPSGEVLRGEGRGDQRADKGRDLPRARPSGAEDDSGDLSVAGVNLSGSQPRLRNRPTAPRRPGRAKPEDPDTAVLRRLDGETLRDMDRAANNGQHTAS
ncbi:chromosome partitioning protein [Asanoa ishikariensis]|uniref:Chromosome partitioning ATPase, Mrp family, contains Fe-S cluster n=1 Tax=Asanoa ishikariensis TaxID=137265 RepID=A0A1H3M823_9ACTN|nr:GNVR domain-containing protein [Asanoa ishikariensis]GIF65952.1 chromosome partitioning protein [Asanoa ishikariensis]SDY72418.1 Chromosome partitioning ATPase, Mrp family, contains Fe-S cluster [Asanoa ishikariensis]